uniref:Uncharacterized protein n=1 Tax=Molossus molossus TaxID=27622 RepID=A0A7J8I7P4_MOLMO|nr:hypothetical protein HJG59_010542 [Molossus molossus]
MGNRSYIGLEKRDIATKEAIMVDDMFLLSSASESRLLFKKDSLKIKQHVRVGALHRNTHAISLDKIYQFLEVFSKSPESGNKITFKGFPENDEACMRSMLVQSRTWELCSRRDPTRRKLEP